jgi:hypothetical protein
MVFCSAGYDTPRTTFEFEYLGEFEIEIKNILEHESGAQIGLIHEKTGGQKSRATVPLNQAPSSVSLILRNLVSFKLGKSCTTKIMEVLLFLHGRLLHYVFFALFIVMYCAVSAK